MKETNKSTKIGHPTGFSVLVKNLDLCDSLTHCGF